MGLVNFVSNIFDSLLNLYIFDISDAEGSVITLPESFFRMKNIESIMLYDNDLNEEVKSKLLDIYDKGIVECRDME
ncbi:MAG: hypothetical protein ACI9N1_002857 [Flavobacteriales bacterium]|jgi:hypothetical protein